MTEFVFVVDKLSTTQSRDKENKRVCSLVPKDKQYLKRLELRVKGKLEELGEMSPGDEFTVDVTESSKQGKL